MLGGLPIRCMKFLFPKEFHHHFWPGPIPFAKNTLPILLFFLFTSSRFFLLLLPPQPNYVLLYSHDHESCDFNIHISTHGITLAHIFLGHPRFFFSSPFQCSNGLQGATKVYSTGMSNVLKNILVCYGQCCACECQQLYIWHVNLV